MFDPHVWFDVNLFKIVAITISKELGKQFPDNQNFYEKNLHAFLNECDSLQAHIKKLSQTLPQEQRVLVTAHDAFRYFGKAYDFEVVGLQGVSTQSEAGLNEVNKLATFISERKIKAIFVESSVPKRQIKAVQDAVQSKGWDVKIGGELFSDALGEAGTDGGTYLGMIKHNIDTIVSSLKGDHSESHEKHN